MEGAFFINQAGAVHILQIIFLRSDARALNDVIRQWLSKKNILRPKRPFLKSILEPLSLHLLGAEGAAEALFTEVKESLVIALDDCKKRSVV